MFVLIPIVLVIGAAAGLLAHGLLVRYGGCLIRQHDTIPLKRIGKHAFVVGCRRCGWLYLKTYEHGQYCYRRYRGQFDDFEDYADEVEEAEPTFVEDDGMNI